jgi:hypothetical protein
MVEFILTDVQMQGMYTFGDVEIGICFSFRISNTFNTERRNVHGFNK